MRFAFRMKPTNSIVLAVAAGTSGWLIANAVYLYPVQAQLLGPVPFLLISSFLVWAFVHFLTEPLLRGWKLERKLLLSVASYLLVGAVILSVAAARQGFSGALLLIPIWPVGVVFVLFSSRSFDPQEIFVSLAVGSTLTIASGFTAGLFHLRAWQVARARERPPGG